MEIIIVLVIAVVALVLLGFLLYYSFQSIKQAKILSHPLTLDKLKDNLDRVVAVHGRPELAGNDGGPYSFPVLWYCRKYQEYRRSGKNSSWRTIDSTEQGYDFHLNFPGGGRIFVTSEPTELHGKGRDTEKEGVFARTRYVHEWFPLAREMTVLGKLSLTDEGGTLGADKKLGMIFSTSEPGKAAFWENVKGYGGITACAVIVLAGILLLFTLA